MESYDFIVCGSGIAGLFTALEAEKRGLDPDKWFNNVELVTAEKIGIETTTYVRNIYKYYVGYKMTLEQIERQKRAREKLAPQTP